jgi:glycosyltransferase involved in cell wall biosynthesis
MPDAAHLSLSKKTSTRCRVVAIWIDWYAYHIARFQGIQKHPLLADGVWGIELVGGIGVHAGLKFRQELPLDLPVETLMPNSSWREANKFALAAKLWRRLSKLDPEVVLVPGYYTLPAIAAALWARFHNRKSVLMTESTEGDHPRVWWRETFKSMLIRLLFNWAISGGKAHMRYLERLNFPVRRIRRFYDVVDNHYLEETVGLLKLKSTSHIGLPHPYFLYVGRLSSEKNVDGLLAEWIQYREHGGTWPLVLVGAGSQTDSLKALASSSVFARDIYFAGHRTFRDLPSFYAFAGCFVLPSTREPWGLVVNEAMAAGLPVLVSSRCGCAEDLVDLGGNGFTFDPLKKDTLAALLATIESLELATLTRMSDRSREIINIYTPEALGAQVASIVTA